MSPDDLKWPVVFTAGTLIRFAPAEDFGAAYFGGPTEQSFSSGSRGPVALHRIFTFSPAGMPQPKGHNLQGRMSLFFGMRYDGCKLRYRVPVMNAGSAKYIRDTLDTTDIVSMSPSAVTTDWPYRAYPEMLPYIPLAIESRETMTSEQFAKELTWQGLNGFSGDELVVVVPAVSRLGVSMWGRCGDAEGVQLVFRYSYVAEEISAVTQCT